MEIPLKVYPQTIIFLLHIIMMDCLPFEASYISDVNHVTLQWRYPSIVTLLQNQNEPGYDHILHLRIKNNNGIYVCTCTSTTYKMYSKRNKRKNKRKATTTTTTTSKFKAKEETTTTTTSKFKARKRIDKSIIIII